MQSEYVFLEWDFSCQMLEVTVREGWVLLSDIHLCFPYWHILMVCHLCSPWFSSAVLTVRSRLGPDSSLVCNWYSHCLLDHINDCKILNSACLWYFHSRFVWVQLGWETVGNEALPKQCRVYDASQHPSPDKEIHCHLKAFRGKKVSLIFLNSIKGMKG